VQGSPQHDEASGQGEIEVKIGRRHPNQWFPPDHATLLCGAILLGDHRVDMPSVIGRKAVRSSFRSSVQDDRSDKCG
jgi:hypothetical protein